MALRTRTKLKAFALAVLLVSAFADANELSRLPLPIMGTEPPDHAVSAPAGEETPPSPSKVGTEQALLTRQDSLIEGIASARLSNAALDALRARLTSRGALTESEFGKLLEEIPESLMEEWQKTSLRQLFAAELGAVKTPTHAPELSAALKRIKDGYAERTRRFAPWAPPPFSANAAQNAQSAQVTAALDLLRGQLEKTQSEISRLNREREETYAKNGGRSRPSGRLMESLLEQLRARNVGGKPPDPNNLAKHLPLPTPPPTHGSRGTESPETDRGGSSPPLFPPRGGRERDDNLARPPSPLFLQGGGGSGKAGGQSESKNSKNEKGEGANLPERKAKPGKGDGATSIDPNEAARNAVLDALSKKAGDGADTVTEAADAGKAAPSAGTGAGSSPKLSPLDPVGPSAGGAAFGEGGGFGGFGGGAPSPGPGGAGSMGGGAFEGDPFSGLGYGAPDFDSVPSSGTLTVRKVEFGTGSGGGPEYEPDDGGNGDGASASEPARRAPSPAEQILLLPSKTGTKTWIMSRVGTVGTAICGGALFDQVAVCKTARARSLARRLKKEGFQQNARTR